MNILSLLLPLEIYSVWHAANTGRFTPFPYIYGVCLTCGNPFQTGLHRNLPKMPEGITRHRYSSSLYARTKSNVDILSLNCPVNKAQGTPKYEGSSLEKYFWREFPQLWKILRLVNVELSSWHRISSLQACWTVFKRITYKHSSSHLFKYITKQRAKIRQTF